MFIFHPRKSATSLTVVLLTSASLLVLSACQSTNTVEPAATAEPAAVTETAQPVEVAAVPKVVETTTMPEPAVRQIDNLQFVDMSVFDSNLSSSLGDKTQAVMVNMPAKFSLNDIPDRMNIWLERVQESGGTINVKPIPDPNAQTRGVIGAIFSIVIELVSYARSEAMYSPADEYNATLMYNEDTGEVEEIIFQQR